MEAALRNWVQTCVFVVCLIAMGTSANTLIDANTATEEQLQSIAGIGPTTAQRIIQTRQKKPFKDLRDFADRVPGVGPKRLQQYSDAGLVVKRTAPLHAASAAPKAQSTAPSEVNSPAAPAEVQIPSIDVIEGGMREHSIKSLRK